MHAIESGSDLNDLVMFHKFIKKKSAARASMRGLACRNSSKLIIDDLASRSAKRLYSSM